MMKDIKQFLVLGLGSFGNSITRTLFELGHEVMAVDSDNEKVEKATDFSTHAVQANIMDENTLKSLGVRNYDAVILAVGEDIKASILVSMLLKEMGCKYLMAKANDNIHAKVLRQLGVDKVVFPERDMGIRVAKSLVTKSVVDIMELDGDYRIVEIKVPKQWYDKSIVDLDVRKKFHVNVLAINRENNYIVSPAPNTIFLEHDVMLILGKSDDVDAIDEISK